MVLIMQEVREVIIHRHRRLRLPLRRRPREQNLVRIITTTRITPSIQDLNLAWIRCHVPFL